MTFSIFQFMHLFPQPIHTGHAPKERRKTAQLPLMALLPDRFGLRRKLRFQVGLFKALFDGERFTRLMLINTQ